MRERKRTRKRIKLVSYAYNFASADAFGFVFKLAYGFPRQDRPELEIFFDSETARAEAWGTYGPKSGAAVFKLRFKAPGEVKALEPPCEHVRVKFVGMDMIDVKYPKTGVEPAAAYLFDVLVGGHGS